MQKKLVIPLWKMCVAPMNFSKAGESMQQQKQKAGSRRFNQQPTLPTRHSVIS